MARELKVGDTVRSRTIGVSPERLRWYRTGLLAAAAGELVHDGPNIHTDQKEAAKEGFTGIIAEGMISTNLILSMLIDEFGLDFVTTGYLRTKYIKPIYVGEVIQASAEVTKITSVDGTCEEYCLDLSVKNTEGTLFTTGNATVRVDVAQRESTLRTPT